MSVDQLQSTTPGLIAQMRGFLTKRRYHYATVFVDQFSKLGFVYLQETSNTDETIQAKEACEAFSQARGVMILHYHADNGRFAEKGWMDHVRNKGQTIPDKDAACVCGFVADIGSIDVLDGALYSVTIETEQ